MLFAKYIECKAYKIKWMNARGTNEKESIYGFWYSINCLNCECMRLMYFYEQNLIKSECWMHEQEYVFCLHSLHLNVRTITSTRLIFGAIDWFEWVQFIWKVYDEK